MLRERRWALLTAYACLGLFAVFFLVPPYYMLVTSLKSSAELASLAANPWRVTQGVTLEHYRNLLLNTLFLTHFKNTASVAALVTIVTLLVSVPAAYALSRLHFVGVGALATGVFLTYLVPPSLLFLPLFQLIGSLNLLDSLWALVLVYPTLTAPFCTWLLLSYFGTIPRELDEAALIDGASRLQSLYYVFLPLARPGLMAAAIFAFTVAWGAFLYPLVFIYSSEHTVLTVGTVSTLIRGDVYYWGGLMAAALFAAAPPVVLYAFLMDYYIAGLTAGATKG